MQDIFEFERDLSRLIELNEEYDEKLPDIFTMEDQSYRNLLDKNLTKYLKIIEKVYQKELLIHDLHVAEHDFNDEKRLLQNKIEQKDSEILDLMYF